MPPEGLEPATPASDRPLGSAIRTPDCPARSLLARGLRYSTWRFSDSEKVANVLLQEHAELFCVVLSDNLLLCCSEVALGMDKGTEKMTKYRTLSFLLIT
jgi:hypothetical protein